MTDLPQLPNLPPIEPATEDDEWASSKPTKGVRIPIPAAALVVIAVGLLGLWGGAQLKGNNASATTANGAANGNGFRRGNGEFPGGGAGGPGGGAAGRGGTVGKVASVNGDTITITTPNGGTVTVTMNGSTTVTKTDSGSISDVTPGENIIVRGTTNSDGSTTADQITVGNGTLGFGFGGRGGGNGNGGPPATQPN